MYYFIKIAITTLLIVLISEVAKRQSLIAALLASLPLMSILAMVWLYVDTGDSSKVMKLSYDILLMILPSLAFFLILPTLLKFNIRFPYAMCISCISMGLIYKGYIFVLANLGVRI